MVSYKRARPLMNRSCMSAIAAAFALQISLACADTKGPTTMQAVSIPTADPLLNKANLDQIKQHIIGLGARCTYVNKYNNNPCWSLAPYVFYLNPDPGPDGNPQWNINCDISRGDFNTLVIGERASGRAASVDFRSKEAILLRAYGRAFEDSPGEFTQDQAMFRTAVAAALQAVKRK